MTTAKELLRRAQQGTPLIEDDSATFVWQGEDPPQLVGDFCGWEWGNPLDLAQVAPGLWAHTLTLPRDAYMEYAFWQEEERRADPLNPRTTPSGLGHTHSFFYMPDAAPTPLIRRRNVPHGTLTRHVVEEEFLLAGRRRTVRLYRPPVKGPVPLLLVLDGQDYRPRGKVINIVENLLAAGRIEPLALALVDHGRSARGVEYACSDAHLAFLLDLVLPLAREALDLVDVEARPGAYGILGASMGGLMALYAGLRAPDTFGRILSQSGAFDFAGCGSAAEELVRHGPLRPIRIWMDTGRYEWLLEPNRRMHALLVERGYQVAYHEFNAGHNYPAWRNDLPNGLETLFGT